MDNGKGDMIPKGININFDYHKCIFQYIRDNKTNQIKGLLIGCKFSYDDKCFYIGWSLCDSDDKFNHNVAFDLAFFRAYTDRVYTKYKMPTKKTDFMVPVSIETNMTKFVMRCDAYFNKDKDEITQLKPSLDKLKAAIRHNNKNKISEYYTKKNSNIFTCDNNNPLEFFEQIFKSFK